MQLFFQLFEEYQTCKSWKLGITWMVSICKLEVWYTTLLKSLWNFTPNLDLFFLSSCKTYIPDTYHRWFILSCQWKKMDFALLFPTYSYFFHVKVKVIHLSVETRIASSFYFWNLTIVSTLQTYVTTNVQVMSKIWESNKNLALDFQLLCFVSKTFSAK